MRIEKLVFGVFIALIFFSCSNPSSDNLLFNKLEGTWKIDNENEFEKWSMNPDGSFNSLMYSVKGTDTVYAENVKIYQNGRNWVFETFVKDQNDSKSVKFESTQLSNTEVTFENPSHDFPKRIHYTLESSAVLKAYITGNSDTVFFNFTKAK